MGPHTTPQQAHYATMTPGQRPQSSSDTLRSNYYANIHASGGQHVGQMPPPAPIVSPTYTQAATMQLPSNAPFGSMQMQTPPPTRGASARKQQHQEQQIAFGTPSTIASRRFMTPQQPVTADTSMPFAQQNPVQFPQLQFSPDMQQFANFGPASAPVMSNSHIMWAQTGASPMQPVPSSNLEDPFAPSSVDMAWTSAGYQAPNVQTVSFDTPAMNGFPVYTPQPRPVSAMAGPVNAPGGVNNQLGPTAVDPSLLYSSPAKPVVRSNSRAKKTRSLGQPSSVDGDPYDGSMHHRTDTHSSTNAVARTSNLHRSNTTGTSRSQSFVGSMSMAESLSRSIASSQITRTASPVKRFGRPSLGSISEGRPRHRTSVVLTIDENGRARTETKRVDDSPTRSIRERYPALYDSDSSDAESEGSDKAPSRPLSFIFDKRDERRNKAARLDPPVENLEGLTIPRSGSAASMKKGVPPSRAAVAAVASLRRQGSLRRSTPNRSQNRRSVTLNSSTASIDTCPMDLSSGLQPASNRAESGSERQNRGSWAAQLDPFDAPSSSAENTLEAHNRRWSIMSYEQQGGLSISPQPQQESFMDGSLHSLNGHSDVSSNHVQMRCECGVLQVNAQPIIQCQSCMQWSHTPCVGLDGQRGSAAFTCHSCRRQTPGRRRPSSRRG